MIRPKIICLTPVKNEAWILERFLKLASLWADYIIIADQISTDNSREIAEKFEKVILVSNSSEEFNEPERQKLLLTEARKIEGPKLLITLDADECFTPNYSMSPEWNTLLNAEPGTIFRFNLYNLQADMKTMWADLHTYPLAYMDNGADHYGPKIDSFRIPMPNESKTIILKEIAIMHYSDTDWERYMSKHRYYNCYKRILNPESFAIDQFRDYHIWFFMPKERYESIPIEWIESYEKLGIDMTSICIIPKRYWDLDILNFFDKYGTSFFKKVYIWNVNWTEIAKLHNKTNPEIYKDPRNKLYKKIHTYLWITQTKSKKAIIRFIDWNIKILLRY